MEIIITLTQEQFDIAKKVCDKFGMTVADVIKEQAIHYFNIQNETNINLELKAIINNATVQDKEIIYNNIKALETSGTITLTKEIATDGNTETL